MAKNNPNSKEKVKARREARKASGLSAQKFYVKTRMEEAAKRGKTLDRASLRKKFQSGDVERKGFAAPKKKSVKNSTNTESTKTVTVTHPTRVAPSRAENQQMLQRKRVYSRKMKP